MKNIIFHIGYHKTGTSWLQQVYFPQHPHIQLILDSKRPWDDPFLSYLIKTPDRKFKADCGRAILDEKIKTLGNVTDDKVVLISAERLSGHPFSGGYDSFRIAHRIKSCVPNAKIICIVRNQVAMINSVYKQLLEEGFAGNIESLFTFKPWKSVCFDLSFYEYDILFEKYISLFGIDNFCILPYENMQNDIKGFLEDWCLFMNIPPIEIPQKLYTTIVNKSHASQSLSSIRFINKFRKSELNPFPVFNLHPIIIKLLLKIQKSILQKDKKLSKEIILRIKQNYKDSNARLLNLVNSDFSLFNCRG